MTKMSETLKRKRVALDMKQKQEIIEKYNGGTKPKELAILFNVSPSTISTIVASKNQEKILQQEESKSKRIRASNFTAVEQHLNNWFADCKSKPSVTIDGTCMKEQAYGHHSFFQMQVSPTGRPRKATCYRALRFNAYY